MVLIRPHNGPKRPLMDLIKSHMDLKRPPVNLMASFGHKIYLLWNSHMSLKASYGHEHISDGPKKGLYGYKKISHGPKKPFYCPEKVSYGPKRSRINL